MSLKQETAFFVPADQDPDAYATRAKQLGADAAFDTIIVRPEYDELDAHERGSLLESTENPNTLVIASGRLDALDHAEQARFHPVDEMKLFERIVQELIDGQT